MQWDASEHAGFYVRHSMDGGQPEPRRDQRGGSVADDDSVFHHYRRLIALRHEDPVVAHGDFHLVLADHPRVYAFVRRHAGAQLLVLANVSGTEVTVEVPEAERWAEADLVLVNVPAPQALQARLTLQPWEARVHRRA